MTPEARLLTRIGDEELERRWSLARDVMRTRGWDALVLQNTNDWLGGYVKWFTDIPATNGYPRTIVFPASGRMTVVEMGPFDHRRDLQGGDPLHRGVGRLVTTPSFPSISYTTAYDAKIAVESLAGCRTIAWINPGALPHGFVSHIEKALGPGVAFVDGTEEIDRIKAVKSPAETALIRQAASLQDSVFEKVLGFIRPGLRDIDVTAYAQDQALVLGSEQGIFLGASAPVGIRSPFMPRWAQGRTLAAGDHLSLLIEVNGPGGFYTEIARSIVLGRASNELKAAFQSVKEAQDYSLSLIRPGAKPAEVHAAHNRWMQERGLPPETRLYAHGQGYDMVERPLIRQDETMPLAENMCLAVHPGYETEQLFAVICDNYLVEANGVSACLHRTEKRIFEI
ncbi:M24 family metallopeptidase [Bradyrhizobium mercantei]|uniref:M24 family metallopeptidase n=1 Tax=Bradyrhizobium mercantei TaxID=1904807 RepID=UPI0013566576|nr:M24 family metallopeptidase [Bradyrhizobium mercantei]